MHKLAEIASYLGNPPAYAISVFYVMFSSVSNHFWLGSAHKKSELSFTLHACSWLHFGLHHWAPAAVPMTELHCLWVRVCFPARFGPGPSRTKGELSNQKVREVGEPDGDAGAGHLLAGA